MYYIILYSILSTPAQHGNVTPYARNPSIHITVHNTTSAMTPPCPTPTVPPHRFFLCINPHRHTTPFPVYNTRHHIHSPLATITQYILLASDYTLLLLLFINQTRRPLHYPQIPYVLYSIIMSHTHIIIHTTSTLRSIHRTFPTLCILPLCHITYITVDTL